MLAGAAVLGLIAWVLLRTSRRLPIGRFFSASSALIAVLAVVLTGCRARRASTEGRALMSHCGCHAEGTNERERGVLRLALVLNANMFVLGAIAGVIAQSITTANFA